MVSDEIASGLDPSASNYIVSSSYAEGNLVRVGGPASLTSTVASTTASTNHETRKHIPKKRGILPITKNKKRL